MKKNRINYSIKETLNIRTEMKSKNNKRKSTIFKKEKRKKVSEK